MGQCQCVDSESKTVECLTAECIEAEQTLVGHVGVAQPIISKGSVWLQAEALEESEPSSIRVRSDVLEEMADRLDVARIPLHLKPPFMGDVFKPLEPRDPNASEGDLPKGHMPVRLHVYDLEVMLMESTWISAVSGVPIYHLGLEVFQLEWCYGAEGIFSVWPGSFDEQRHRKTVFLGYTKLTIPEVLALLCELHGVWKGDDYRLVGFNCQTFVLEFAKRLGLAEDCIPKEYLRFAASLTEPARGGDKIAEAPEATHGPGRIRL